MGRQSLQVFLRMRPPSAIHEQLSYLPHGANSIELHVPRNKLSNAKDRQFFTFNGVFEYGSSQGEIFQSVGRQVVENCLQGFNGTIFAYGQTGSGKTFSMSGGDQWQERGLIPRVITELYEEIDRRPEMAWEVGVSYIEIYNENAYDLLGQQSQGEGEDSVPIQLKHIRTYAAQNEQVALRCHLMGQHARKVSCTRLNMASSRSHSIFTLTLTGTHLVTGAQVCSKLNLVDLAGSERIAKSQAEGSVLTEAKSINLSLSYLEQVIIALNHKKTVSKQHIPYRNSLLTTFLKDSLGGNCRTVMLATISGDRQNLEETVSTLRFAQRVSLLENEITPNQKNVYGGKLEWLQRENEALRVRVTTLEGQGTAGVGSEDEVRRVSDFMNGGGDLQVASLGQAKRLMLQMRDLYQGRLTEYVRQLTFISQKLARYDQLIGNQPRR